jgi:predicted RNase H-like nuclease
MNFDFTDKFSEAELKMLFPELNDYDIRMLRETASELLRTSMIPFLQNQMCATAETVMKIKKIHTQNVAKDDFFNLMGMGA